MTATISTSTATISTLLLQRLHLPPTPLHCEGGTAALLNPSPYAVLRPVPVVEVLCSAPFPLNLESNNVEHVCWPEPVSITCVQVPRARPALPRCCRCCSLDPS